MVAQLRKQAIDVGIIVQDADRALAFWRDTLGFPVDDVRQLPDGAGAQYRLRCGASLVKLMVLTTPPAPGAGGPPLSLGGFRYVTIFVDNLDEIVESCRAAGYTIAVEPKISPIFPNRIAFIEDPDGNSVELFEPDPE
jgi:catechol 2,3-dioxygenase-like lactoylglutathione lyase family enzyme